jgi:hypothetical protein
VYVRLPAEALAKLDAWVEELRTSVPGGTGISRSDLIRDVVVKAVEEREGGSKAKRVGRTAP